MDNQLFHHHQPMLLPKIEELNGSPHCPTMNSDFYCLYKTNKCRNLRGVKRDGTLHRLCNEHREKANESQRKSETKKRIYKRTVLDHQHHEWPGNQATWSPTVQQQSNHHIHNNIDDAHVFKAGYNHSISQTRQWGPDESEQCSKENSTFVQPRRMTLDYILVDADDTSMDSASDDDERDN